MERVLEEHSWYSELPREGRLVVSRALHQVDTRYGVNEEEVVPPYYYHNGTHTRMACEDLAILKDTLGLTESEFMLGVAAMASHDVVKTFGRDVGVDEAESADWLESELSTIAGISKLAIVTGRLAVIGTTPRFHEGTIIQKAVEQVYPTKRAELIAHAVAGADVGRLFTLQGPSLSHQLYREMRAVDGDQTFPIEELVPFQDSQIEFLLSYKYPNRDIENSLAIHKAPVIRYLGKLSRMLEQGAIEDWQQLLDLDERFAESTI